MSTVSVGLPDDLQAYLVKVGVREPEILARLRAETAQLPMHDMQIASEQGALMQLLVELIGARTCLELGTFTGYSSLAVALALPPDGRIVCCDVSAEWTSIARRYWAEAGVADKVDLRLGPALETLDGLLAEGQAATFDFAFLDADKGIYPA
jgi:predicted O-methyltransferase YrrM